MYKLKTLYSKETNIDFKKIIESEFYEEDSNYNFLVVDKIPSAWIEIKEAISNHPNIKVTFGIERELEGDRITFIPLGKRVLTELAKVEKFLSGQRGIVLDNTLVIYNTQEQFNALGNTGCKAVQESALKLHELCFVEPEDFDIYETLQKLKNGRDFDCSSKRGNYLVPPEFLVSSDTGYQPTINFFNSLEQEFLIEGDEGFEELQVLFEDVEASIPSSWDSFLGEDLKLDLSDKEAMKLAYLCRLAGLGFVKRFGKNNPVALKRLKFELSVIAKKNFFNYFLIVWDLIRYAKSKKIAVGKGRGSVCGSILAYCLYITDVDPLKHNLKFERFLSIFRKNKPDIDIDFPENKVHLIWEYLAYKYGDYAHIITFKRYSAVGALASIKNLYKVPDNLAALVSKGWKGLISDFIETKEGLKLKIALKNKGLIEKVETIDKLIGLPQSISIHPSGIVIEKNLSNSVPIITIDGLRCVPFTKTDDQIERVGLIKFDILRLKTLNVIESIRGMIGTSDFSNDLFNDAATINTYAKGDTVGVFQFKSQGITRTCEEVKPESFDEISDILALYRPGPMDEIKKYVFNKNHTTKDIFGIGQEALKLSAIFPVIEPTNYVIVYQEQIIEIAQVWAGYDLASADNFRRAISGKKEAALLAEKESFINAAAEKLGREKQHSEMLFDLILKFALYGYNKSHSVGYSKLSFETAYYKTHYPVQFYIASLNNALTESDKKERISSLMKDAIQHNIKFKLPNTDEFYDSFFAEGDVIHMPISVIAGIGANTVEEAKYNPESIANNKSLSLLNEYPTADQLRKLSIEIELFDMNLNKDTYVIKSIRTIIDKKGREMAFIDFYNNAKSFPVFADTWKKFNHLKAGNLVYPVISGNNITNFKQS